MAHVRRIRKSTSEKNHSHRTSTQATGRARAGAPDPEYVVEVLFLVHNLGKTRHFEGVIQELTERVTRLVITAAHKRNKPLKLGAFRNNPRVDVV